MKIEPGGRIVESITDARYDNERGWNYGGYGRSTTEQASGTVRTAATGNQPVTVTTYAPLTSRLQHDSYTGDTPESPFSGSIEMLAEDGSLLFIQANAVNQGPNISSQWARFDYTTASAEQVVVESAPYYSPGLSQRICVEGPGYNPFRPFRNSVTQRLYCGYGFVDF